MKESKDTQLHLRVRSNLKDAAERVADAYGLTLSAWITSLIVREINSFTQGNPDMFRPPSPPNTLDALYSDSADLSPEDREEFERTAKLLLAAYRQRGTERKDQAG